MSERFIPEEYTKDQSQNVESESLPINLAKAFVGGSFEENTPVVYSGKNANVYRIHEQSEPIADMQNTSLYLDYVQMKTKKEETEDVFDQLRFEYGSLNEFSGQYRQVAEMHLGIAPSNVFILQHRYVKPEFRRGRGIGTKLLKQVESFLQQVANEKKEDTTVILKTGQESVIKWLEKQGYEVVEDQQVLRNELKNHPDRFFQAKVILSEESTRDSINKDEYTFRKGETGRYMENAIRLTFKKVIKPSGEK